MFYPHLTAGLKKIIWKQFPDAKPVSTNVDHLHSGFRMACYLLWMLDELQKFDDAAKRGRWMGYVQGRMEAIGLLLNTKNRELTRLDVQAGSPM